MTIWTTIRHLWDNFEPNPKNPIIASFFRNIGHSDQLGSGVRNLFKYSKYYSGKEPELIEGDVFKIIVPLDDEYSFDAKAKKMGDKNMFGEKFGEKFGDIVLTEKQREIIAALGENNQLSAKQLAEITKISSRAVEKNIKKLREIGVLTRIGSPRKGYWKITIH